MANKSEPGGNKMTNSNGNGLQKNEFEARENRRLQILLQKAVTAEKAPESLRLKISKMIREK